MHKKLVILSAFFISTLASACDSVVDSPTDPSSGLTVEQVSSDTRLEQIAIRIQLRLRVLAGRDMLASAVSMGSAAAEVCVDAECASEDMVAGQVDGACETAVGFGAVELASVWLDGNQVGIDYCVPITTNAETYTTTVSAGQQDSNVIETTCGQSGGFLTCGPG